MYSIRWNRAAIDELARLWLDSPDKAAVSRAADEIDPALSRHPGSIGESRSGSTRVAFFGPLLVVYDVQEKDRRVDILAVGPSDPRRR